MELRDLEIYARVADSGDFSAASRSLGITPSAVSKAVQRLEKHLRVRLFNRSSRSLTLTAEGQDFLGPANAVLTAAQEAQASVSGLPSGVLRVRSVPTFATYQLAPLMLEFQARNPEMVLEFSLSNERIASLDNRADIAIAVGELPSSNLVAKRIGSARWIMCASPLYAHTHGLPKSVEDFASHKCLDFMSRETWNAWPARFQTGSNPRRNGAMVANQGEMLAALARSGAGIARLADFHISADIEQGRLVALPTNLQDQAQEPIWVLYPQRLNLSPRIKVYVDFLEEKLSSSPWRVQL
ncbi:Transcriptional regulator, LysR family [Pseudomonas synxantha]|uniref:Transcriptional regulator, LysR family n=1 Tax=Pseudomonas synxantha TaxID=47883 RepID=A0A3G7U7D8_9PSED|nr:LysR family transcriptional regulator [Pseudomonas synxantha]AZE55210.1 Transcriptional regulator, LysR family [Pseudomonas synxantha]